MCNSLSHLSQDASTLENELVDLKETQLPRIIQKAAIYKVQNILDKRIAYLRIFPM